MVGAADNFIIELNWSNFCCTRIRASTREPHMSLVDMGRHSSGCRTSFGSSHDDPGARLVVADLVHAGTRANRGDERWALGFP